MWIAATALGVAIGIIIGGLGGGGGVLAVPALVYVLGQNAQDATTSSVIIVGIGAAAGVLARWRGGVDWRTGAALGAAGIPMAYLGTALNYRVGQPTLLLAFAGLTVTAAVALLLNARDPGDHDADPTATTDGPGMGASQPSTRHAAVDAATPTPTALATVDSRPDKRHERTTRRVVTIVACGAAIGFLTGFLGVGGGFLIVPALVIALRLPITLAIGTSLLVIVLNSVSAMASRIDALHLDWTVVAPFTIAAVAGTLVGKLVADRLSGAVLTRSFAVLLIAVGVGVGTQSLVAL